MIIIPQRIHRAGIYANIKGGFVDGIHGAPYIAAPWILWMSHWKRAIFMSIGKLPFNQQFDGGKAWKPTF